MHPDDLAALGLADGDAVRLGNRRGETRLPRAPAPAWRAA